MKLCDYIIGCVFLLFVAPVAADSISCMNRADKNCAFTAKNNGNDVYIYGFKQVSPIFTIPETETTVETISFFYKDNKYTLIKENSNSNKTKETLSFNDKLNEFEYLYLTSDVDLTTNNKYWRGVYCFSSHTTISDSSASPFEWAFARLCKKGSGIQNEYKYIGADLFFSIDSVINGEMNQIKLVAFNAKNTDNISISELGCLENCSLVNRYIGKINDKYLVKMTLNITDDSVDGGYFYEKIKKIIPFKGIKNSNEIILNVEGEDGKIKETFNGVIDDNKIRGVWSNKKNNTNYSFVLYRSFS